MNCILVQEVKSTNIKLYVAAGRAFNYPSISFVDVVQRSVVTVVTTASLYGSQVSHFNRPNTRLNLPEDIS